MEPMPFSSAKEGASNDLCLIKTRMWNFYVNDVITLEHVTSNFKIVNFEDIDSKFGTLLDIGTLITHTNFQIDRFSRYWVIDVSIATILPILYNGVTLSCWFKTFDL